MDGFLVVLWNCLHRGEIAFDALLLKGGFIEVGIGANKETWLTFNGGAKCVEVASSLRRYKENGLLSFGGDRYSRAFNSLLVPGFDLGEPVVRRLVCSPTKKGDDEKQMIGLACGKFGLDPYLVSRLQVGHLSDRQRGTAACDADGDPGTDEVKTCVIGTET